MGGLSEEMLSAFVCEKMHWTYEQYLDQPQSFIATLFAKWSADARYTEMKEKEK